MKLFRFKNRRYQDAIETKDEQIVINYNGNIVESFNAQSIKARALGQALFDMFISFSAIDMAKAIELVKAYDREKTRGNLENKYNQDKQFFLNLKAKGDDEQVSRSIQETKAEYLQNLINFLNRSIGGSDIDFSRSASGEVEETGEWEIVNILTPEQAVNLGKGMGNCIYGNNYSNSGGKIGQPVGGYKEQLRSAGNFLDSTYNRVVNDARGGNYGSQKTFTGQFTKGSTSPYFMLRDPSRPNDANTHDRYTIVYCGKGEDNKPRYLVWNDFDLEFITYNIQASDYKRYSDEHDGEEGVYCETVVATPHINTSGYKQARQFVARLKLVNSKSKSLLDELGINVDELQQEIDRMEELVKGTFKETYGMTNFNPALTTSVENELSNPEEQRRAALAREANERAKRVPITDEVRFTFLNDFISFRFNITSSLYDRGLLAGEFRDYFHPIADLFKDTDDENDNDTLNAINIYFREPRDAKTLGLFIHKLLLFIDKNSNKESDEVQFSFTLKMLVKPKVIADFLILDNLTDAEASELRRPDTIKDFDSTVSLDEIKKIEDLLMKDEGFQSLFNFITKFFEWVTYMLIKPVYNSYDAKNKITKSRIIGDIMKKAVITKEDARNIALSIVDQEDNYKPDSKNPEDKAFGNYFKEFNKLFAGILGFKFPEDIYYYKININKSLDSKKARSIVSNVRDYGRDTNFMLQVSNIFYNKYYKDIRVSEKTQGVKKVDAGALDRILEKFAQDINALHIKFIEDTTYGGLDTTRRPTNNHTKLTEDEKNAIINNGNITTEEAEEINNANQTAIEEKSSNESKEEINATIKEYNEKGFFTKKTDLPRVNLSNCYYPDIEWADMYVSQVGIINRLMAAYPSVLAFIQEYAIKPKEEIDSWLKSIGLTNSMIKSIKERLEENGKYNYLLTEDAEQVNQEEKEQEEEKVEEQQEETINVEEEEQNEQINVEADEENEEEEPEIIEEEQESVPIEEPEIIEEEPEEVEEEESFDPHTNLPLEEVEDALLNIINFGDVSQIEGLIDLHTDEEHRYLFNEVKDYLEEIGLFNPETDNDEICNEIAEALNEIIDNNIAY